MTSDRAIRLAAYERRLALPDPATLRRAHRLTQPGAPSRWLDCWLPAARTYLEHELSVRTGALEGWWSARPAVPERAKIRRLR